MECSPWCEASACACCSPRAFLGLRCRTAAGIRRQQPQWSSRQHTNRCCNPPQKKKSGAAGLWLEPQRRQMKVLGREGSGEGDSTCTAAVPMETNYPVPNSSCSNPAEGEARAAPSREGPAGRDGRRARELWGSAPGAGAPGRRGRGNRDQAREGLAGLGAVRCAGRSRSFSSR